MGQLLAPNTEKRSDFEIIDFSPSVDNVDNVVDTQLALNLTKPVVAVDHNTCKKKQPCNPPSINNKPRIIQPKPKPFIVTMSKSAYKKTHYKQYSDTLGVKAKTETIKKRRNFKHPKQKKTIPFDIDYRPIRRRNAKHRHFRRRHKKRNKNADYQDY